MERLRRWARRLKRDALVVWLAARHREVPLLAKLVAGLVAAYAFSPIDLIPDVIPVLGLLDDLLIVPAGLWLAFCLIPAALQERLREEAAAMVEKPVSRVGMLMVALAWLLAGLLAWRWLS